MSYEDSRCPCGDKKLPGTMSESLIDRMLEIHPLIGARERHNIRRALDAARAYGYGNVMAWLATEWAVKLRDEQGLSEDTAILAVSNRSPYALPPNAPGERPPTDGVRTRPEA